MKDNTDQLMEAAAVEETVFDQICDTVAKEPPILAHDIEITKEDVEDFGEDFGEEEDAPSDADGKKVELTPAQAKMVQAIRKNPKRFLALLRRKKYFNEENMETAIVNALNSGLGRKVRRNLCKKMMLDWRTFLEYEDIVVESHLDELKPSAIASYLARKRQQLSDRKIGKRDYRTAVLIAEHGLTFDQANDLLDYACWDDAYAALTAVGWE